MQLEPAPYLQKTSKQIRAQAVIAVIILKGSVGDAQWYSWQLKPFLNKDVSCGSLQA